MASSTILPVYDLTLPRFSSHTHWVESSTLSANQRAHLHALYARVEGGSSLVRQHAEMGRGFLDQDPSNGSWIMGKGGTGHTRASDNVWRWVGEKAQARASDQHIVRVENVGSIFPIVASLDIDHEGKRVRLQYCFWDGFHHLQSLMREYLVTEFCEENGIPAPKTMSVVEHASSTPWGEHSYEAMTEHLKMCITTSPQARQLGFDSYDFSLNLHERTGVYAPDLRGGRLYRWFESEPIRVQDVVNAMTSAALGHGSWDDLDQIIRGLDGQAKRRSWKRDCADAFSRLGGSKALHGLIHQRMDYRWQNAVIPQGVFCDFDHAVVSPALNADGAARLQERMSEWDEKLGFEGRMLKMYQSDAVGLQDESKALLAILAEEYLLFTTVLRLEDCVNRAETRQSAPGLTLYPTKVEALAPSFVRGMLASAGSHGRSVLQAATSLSCDPADVVKILRVGSQKTTGWQHSNHPHDSNLHVESTDHTNFVLDDFKSFTGLVSEIAQERFAKSPTRGNFTEGVEGAL